MNRNKQLQYEYIQDCLYELRKFDYSELEKHQACSCRYYYLFSKYGKSIFNDEFVIPTKSDSLAVINCLLEALSLDSINGEEILIKMNELHK
ncbi:MAG: hypothetical protein ACP5FK_12670 [bacterium]